MSIENKDGIVVDVPQGITPERLQGVISKEIALDTLSADERGAVRSFLSRQTGGTPPPAAAPAVEPPKPEGEAPKAPEAPTGGDEPQSPEDVPLDRPEKRQSFFDRYKEKAAEANRNKQLLEKTQREAQALRQKLEALEKRQRTKPTDDPLDVESQQALRDEVDLLREKLDAITSHSLSQAGAIEAAHADSLAELEAQRVMLGLEQLQVDSASDQFPPGFSLKTTVPIGQLNEELNAFAASLGGIEKVNDYLNDPVYRAEVEKRGLRLSKAFHDNLERFNTLFEINRMVVEEGFKDHATAYLSHLHKSGKLREMTRSAKLEGVRAAVDQVSGKANETPLLPNAGGEPMKPGWTVASARKWMADNSDKLRPGTPEHAFYVKELQPLIRGGKIQ